ncbi:MAG: lycopene cyclase family protein [Chloroflexota bacterium]
MEQYDLVIAGGGAAGLSLAHHLAHSPLGNRSILIVDRDTKERNDRTWCFWTDRPTPFDGIVHRSWDRLRFAADGFQRTIPLEPYRYQMIRGIDFYRFVRQDLSGRPKVEFLRGTVQRIEDGPDGARVRVDGVEYRGRWVFDSLFDLSQLEPRPSRYHRLLQQFTGWEIETPESRFDPGAATFLDFRTSQKGAVRFFYLLPLSERRALVEYVACAVNPLLPGEADEAFGDYVGSVLEIGDYRILAREGGVSPMTDQPFPRRIGRSVLAIGVRGGRLKPSTGLAGAGRRAAASFRMRSVVRRAESSTMGSPVPGCVLAPAK